MSYDKITTEERIGERHPVLKIIGRAVIIGGMFTILGLYIALAFTNVAVAQKEYAIKNSFQPVHMSEYLKTH